MNHKKELLKWLNRANAISCLDELNDLIQDIGLEASIPFSKQTLIKFIEDELFELEV